MSVGVSKIKNREVRVEHFLQTPQPCLALGVDEKLNLEELA